MNIHEGIDSGPIQFWRNHMLLSEKYREKHIFYVCHKLDSKQLHRLNRLDFLKQLHFLGSELQMR